MRLLTIRWYRGVRKARHHQSAHGHHRRDLGVGCHAGPDCSLESQRCEGWVVQLRDTMRCDAMRCAGITQTGLAEPSMAARRKMMSLALDLSW